MQILAVLTSLQEEGIEYVYIELLKEIYTNSSMTAHHLHRESNKINSRRVVRQGVTISPKLLTAALVSIFGRLIWETGGLKIDGEYLSHLRFADDIQLLQELADESENQGVKITNQRKTKVMMEDDTPIYVNNVHSDRER